MSATTLTMQPLREIRLYGHLGREFGRVHRLAVDTAAEAIQALSTIFPRFRQAIRKDKPYRLLIGRGERRHAIGEAALGVNMGAADCLRIVPEVSGAKRQGVGQTILGIVLVVVGVYTGNTYLTEVGVSMILGGVVQLLSPQRQSSTGDKKSDASYVFDGPVNVTQQGGPVPLVIGRCICGSVVVSSGLHADDISPRPQPPFDLPDLPYEQGRYPGLPPGQDPDGGFGGHDAYGDKGS